MRVAKRGPGTLQRPPLEKFPQKSVGSLGTQVRFLEPIFPFLGFLKFYGPSGKKLGERPGTRIRGWTSCQSGRDLG